MISKDSELREKIENIICETIDDAVQSELDLIVPKILALFESLVPEEKEKAFNEGYKLGEMAGKMSATTIIKLTDKQAKEISKGSI